MTDPLSRPPPCDLDAERATLGSMLLDPRAIEAVHIEADEFYREDHRRIYTLVKQKHARGEPIDLVILTAVIPEQIEYLVQLVEAVPSWVNAEYYAKIVHDCWRKRELLRAASEVVEACYGRGGADDLQRLAHERISGVNGTLPAKPRSFRELAVTYEHLRPPLIDGLLRRGETMNIIAPSKTGKSWLVSDLALAVCTGRMWLETYQPVRGNVLVIDNELHGETLRFRIPRVALKRTILDDEYADSLFAECWRGQLRDLYYVDRYCRQFKSGDLALLVLDAFYRFLPLGTNENDNGSMAALYNVLDGIADHLQCGIAVVHHSSKGLQSHKAVTDVGAGAGAQSRATDTHLVLREHDEPGVCVLDAAVRSWPPIEPVCLRWEWPVWHLAPELDPTALKQPGKRTNLAVEEFVARFVTSAKQLGDTIIGRAQVAGVGERRARALLRQSVDQGLVYWVPPSPGRRAEYSTLPIGENANVS